MGALNPIYKPLGHISLLSEVTTMSNSNLQHRSQMSRLATRWMARVTKIISKDLAFKMNRTGGISLLPVLNLVVTLNIKFINGQTFMPYMSPPEHNVFFPWTPKRLQKPLPNLQEKEGEAYFSFSGHHDILVSLITSLQSR